MTTRRLTLSERRAAKRRRRGRDLLIQFGKAALLEIVRKSPPQKVLYSPPKPQPPANGAPLYPPTRPWSEFFEMETRQ